MTVHKQIIRIYYCFVFSISLNSQPAFSQKNVDVNLLTGTAQVTIPIHMLKVGDISVPIAMFYNAGGIKVEDYFQNYGLGWNLNAESSVTRIMKGYPDDLDNSSKKGWLKISDMGSKIEGFNPANDNSTATCSDEVTDYTYMNSNFPTGYDTEPDIFVVDGPGFHFQFVFDKNQVIKLIPYQDVNITYTLNSTNGTIDQFVVLNDQGIKYTFAKKDTAGMVLSNAVSSPDVFKRNKDLFNGMWNPKYYRYIGGNRYSLHWYLSSIEDTKGNALYYYYKDTLLNDNMLVPPVYSSEKMSVVKWNAGTSAYDIQKLYDIHRSVIEKRIERIEVVRAGESLPGENIVEFIWQAEDIDAPLSRILLKDVGKYVDFEYLTPSQTNYNVPTRRFLNRLYFSPGLVNTSNVYYFTYKNVAAYTSYYNSYDSITNAQDYWGYFNGAGSNTDLIPKVWVYPDNSSVDEFRITPITGYSGNYVLLDGNDRSATTDAISGTLEKIFYPNGGVTFLEYELNTFLDKDLSSGVSGGGIRVKKISDNDGLNIHDVTEYFYNSSGSSGTTTGRAISMPKFALAIPNSTTYSTLTDRVKNSVYRTLNNYSDESTQIIYGKVTVSKTNGGKAIHEFNTDGTWGSSDVNEWKESMVYVTRPYTSAPSPCTAIAPDFLKNGKNNYPFPQNANYDFERGLPVKVTLKNESGNTMREETFVYQRSNTASLVQALKFDNLLGDISYSKYNIVTSTSDLPLYTEVKTWAAKSSYDANAYTTERETFYFTGSGHKKVTKIEKTNSDGNIAISRYSYVKDYASTSTGDNANQALYHLKDLNVNSEVENYTAVKIGSNEKIVKAVLVTYKAFTNPATSATMYLPYEGYSLVSQAGLAPSTSGGFYPSSISSNNFQMSSFYKKKTTFTGYDRTGNPLCVVGNSRNASTLISDPLHEMKVAEFNNAYPAEVSYTSFDFQNDAYALSLGGNSIYSPGHSSKSCLSFSTGTSLTCSINKAATNSDIVFSCYISNASSSGNLTINLSASGLNQDYPLNYSSGAGWKYYEIKMPKPSQSPITVTVSTSVTNIRIDDILIYPANAGAKSYSYITNETAVSGLNANLLSAELGINGTAKYYEYDGLNRPMLVRDAFNNIVEVKSYKAATASLSLATPGISWSPAPARINGEVVFSASGNDAIANLAYTWNFGDGSAEVTTGTYSAAHTYSSAGAFTVTCTVAASGYTSVSGSTSSFYVEVIPIICASGITERTVDNTCIQSTCSSIGYSSCVNTKFKLLSITGGTLSSAVWETAPVDDDTWTEVTPGAGGIVLIGFGPTAASYRIRCRVTTTTGKTGTSDIIYLYNSYVP